MIGAGIDMGAHSIKVVITKDGKVIGRSVVPAGWDAKESARDAMSKALQEAGISQGDINHIVATGVGRADVPFDVADHVTGVTCDAKGTSSLLPSARTVIDIGAENSCGIKCDKDGKVMDFATNDKCAAGVGAFVSAMARLLEVDVKKMAELSLKSDKDIPINVTCVIFAESEVVSLLHQKTKKEDISRAVHDAIAARTTSMARRVGIDNDVALIGGVANSPAIIDSLKRALEVEILIPEKPEFVGALGAALIAESKA